MSKMHQFKKPSAAQVNILALKYCDMGNKSEMNYQDFCSTCDPDILASSAGDRRVNLKPNNTYFTRSYASSHSLCRTKENVQPDDHQVISFLDHYFPVVFLDPEKNSSSVPFRLLCC